MEIGFRRIFLVLAAGSCLHATVSAAADVPSLDELQEVESVIQPDVARVQFDESGIETGDFELVPALGLLSIEDFGANFTLNVRFNYHVSEDFFVGAEIGRSEGGMTSYETLSGSAPLLTDEQRILTYYLFNLGYNLFPGEVFMSDKITYNTAVYVIAGMGSADFAGDTRLDFALGLGYRMMFEDFFSVNLEMRDHAFNMDVLGTDKLTHNLELTLGLGFYF